MGEQALSRHDFVAEICRRFPHAADNCLARKLAKEHPTLFKDHEAARNAVRHSRGNRGKRSRNTVTKPRRLPPIPQSQAKPWLPFEVDAKNVLVLSDVHLPHHSKEALTAAFKDGDKLNPDCVLLNGDILDFGGISRFARDPRGPSVSDELKMCEQFLSHVRGRYPKARIVWKLGNHEERWEKMLWAKAPEILDIAEFAWHKLAGVSENGVEVVGEQRPIMLGKLWVLHGHELPKGMTSPVNPARGAFLRTLTSVLHGHGHRTSEHTERTMDGRIITCRTTGCLCTLTPDYSRVSKWDQGFATVHVAKDGNYEVGLRRIIDGKVY
jgi:predicted phosphodiesterase